MGTEISTKNEVMGEKEDGLGEQKVIKDDQFLRENKKEQGRVIEANKEAARKPP